MITLMILMITKLVILMITLMILMMTLMILTITLMILMITLMILMITLMILMITLLMMIVMTAMILMATLLMMMITVFYYTAKNATDFSILFLNFSSSCNKSVKIRLVAICHLQTCYNLLKQLVTSLWVTSFDNQLATSLLITCNRLVVNKWSQAMRTYPDIGLLITRLLQDVNRLVTTCAFLDVYNVILTKTFAHARYFINEDFCANNSTKWTECRKQIGVLEFFR